MKTSLMKNESGIALVTAILVLMLTSALMAGMFAALLANQRSHATDRDQSVAYAAAHAGLEKLTAGLAALFSTDFSPSAAQLSIIDNTPPAITGFTYTAPGGVAGSGYEITFTPDPGPGANTGNPLAFPSTDITTGPFEGFKGLITPYTLTVTARSLTGNSEVRLRRELQTVAVPVFQFGIFGEKSLGFHAGPNFDFGGRVHTNQSLYIAVGQRLDADVPRQDHRIHPGGAQHAAQRPSIVLTSHTGQRVDSAESSAARRATIGISPTPRAAARRRRRGPGWKNLSEVTYRTNIRTEATGAKQLNLPLTSAGATPIDLIRRPRGQLSRERQQSGGVWTALFRSGELAHPAVGSDDRYHEPADDHGGRAAAARWRRSGRLCPAGWTAVPFADRAGSRPGANYCGNRRVADEAVRRSCRRRHSHDD